MHYQNLNPSKITAINGRLQNWCSQTLKRLHQLHKSCSFGGKAIRKAPYQSSESEPLKCLGRPRIWGLCLHSFSTATWALRSRLAPAGDTIEGPFLLHATGVPLHFHPPWPIIPFFYLFTGFCALTWSFYERNSNLYTVEGPSQQIKTQKYKQSPIRELAADQPLPQRDPCYLQSGPGLRPSDSLLWPQRRTLRWSRSRCSRRPRGQSVSIKLTCFAQNERTRGVSMFGVLLAEQSETCYVWTLLF